MLSEAQSFTLVGVVAILAIVEWAWIVASMRRVSERTKIQSEVA